MSKAKLNEFYSSYRRYSEHHISEKHLNKLVPCLKRCVASLSERDNSEIFEVREIDTKPLIEYCGDHSFLGLYNWGGDDKSFVIGVKGPFWKRGWRKVINNEELYDHVSWFFHFANQYVTRGRAIESLGALSLTFDETFEYIGSPRISERSFLNSTPLNFPCDFDNDKYAIFDNWINKINGMDPFIQRALYFYFRFIDLRNHGYFDEAITALDKVIDIGHKFLLERKLECRRDDFVKFYSLEEDIQNWVNQIYEVRSLFGGHPSNTKWWDSEELYGEWLDESSPFIKQFLSAMFDYENNNRLIEKNPLLWSEWFKQNCMTIYNSVWFHKLPF